MFAAPTIYISLLRHPAFDRHDLASLRKILYGASIMPVPVLNELRRRLPNARLYNGYGQSEIGPLATILKPEKHDERPTSAGKPILNVRTRVVDPQMSEVGPMENGEIVHRSPQLMVGYWDKPEETEEAFRGGWFHSGDLGYMDEGAISTSSTGSRTSSTRRHSGLGTRGRGRLVRSRDRLGGRGGGAPGPRVDRGRRRRGGAQERDGAGRSPREELRARARKRLAPFKVPKHVFFVDDLPRNASGKILKRELRARFANEVSEWSSHSSRHP